MEAGLFFVSPAFMEIASGAGDTHNMADFTGRAPLAPNAQLTAAAGIACSGWKGCLSADKQPGFPLFSKMATNLGTSVDDLLGLSEAAVYLPKIVQAILELAGLDVAKAEVLGSASLTIL